MGFRRTTPAAQQSLGALPMRAGSNPCPHKNRASRTSTLNTHQKNCTPHQRTATSSTTMATPTMATISSLAPPARRPALATPRWRAGMRERPNNAPRTGAPPRPQRSLRSRARATTRAKRTQPCANRRNPCYAARARPKFGPGPPRRAGRRQKASRQIPPKNNTTRGAC